MDEPTDTELNEVASALIKLGDQMAYMYDKQLLSRFKFSERLKLLCCKCQIAMMYHPSKVVDHPFFMNNLEFLEWEDGHRAERT